MSLKMFRFTIENMTTKEIGCFIGQGTTALEAVSEAVKLAHETFRPSSSGAKRPQNTISVQLPDGRRVSRPIQDFEGDIPYSVQPPAPEGSPAVGPAAAQLLYVNPESNER